jgi:hypothetical protein
MRFAKPLTIGALVLLGTANAAEPEGNDWVYGLSIPQSFAVRTPVDDVAAAQQAGEVLVAQLRKRLEAGVDFTYYDNRCVVLDSGGPTVSMEGRKKRFNTYAADGTLEYESDERDVGGPPELLAAVAELGLGARYACLLPDRAIYSLTTLDP